MKKLISLFSGCGGMDLGFEGDFDILKNSYNNNVNPNWNVINVNNYVLLPKTNFETILANDILETAKKAWVPYFKNKNSGIFINDSIVNLVKDGGLLKYKRKGVDVITGGFPCQDFSVAGKRKGFNSHKSHFNEKIDENDYDTPTEETRGMLYYWMRQAIDIVQPKVFIAENVKGLKSMPNVVGAIKRDFENTGDEGYFVIEPRVINAANYGIPQNRERIFFIGFNKKHMRKKALKKLESGYLPDEYDPFPEITHTFSKNMDLFKNSDDLKDVVTTEEAFQGLNEPNLEKLDSAQMVYSKAKYFHGLQGNIELKNNKVGPTIRAEHHGNIEFRRLSKEHGGVKIKELDAGLIERRLTVRECARIQTFPDDYEFVRNNNKDNYNLSASASYKLIGNAVPPLLGFHFAKKLENIWNNIFLKGR